MTSARGGGSAPPLRFAPRTEDMRTPEPIRPSAPGLRASMGLDRQRGTAGSSRKRAILDAFHFGDLIDKPDAGKRQQHAECQGEHVDHHAVAVVLLLPGALIFSQ